MTHTRKPTVFCRLLFAILLGGVFMTASSGQARKYLVISPSLDLQRVLDLTDKVYASAKRTHVNTLLAEEPLPAAMLVGLTMRGQMRHAAQSAGNRARFEKLKQEALALFREVMDHHGDSIVRNGQIVTYGNMERVFYQALNGDYDQQWVNAYGVNPGNADLPSLVADSSSAGSSRQHGDFFREDSGAIDLLDNQANEVVVDPSTQPRERQPDPPKPRKQPIDEYTILGTWQRAKDKECGWSIRPDSEMDNYFIRFRRGSGRDIFIGETSDGDVFRIRSGKRYNEFAIQYDAVWECRPRELCHYLPSDRKLMIEVGRVERNQIVLCRGKCGQVLSSLFKKVGQ